MAVDTLREICETTHWRGECANEVHQMPVLSEAQRRLMYAVLEGKSDAVPKSVAKEMIEASHGVKDLPERVKKRGRKRADKSK